MSEKSITFTIDDVDVEASPGQTILEAADEAGIYIPRLCYHPELKAFGACRVCTVKVNGRFAAACTQPAAQGAVVENESEEILAMRRSIVDMLFVEGNHFCMFCEKSGNCELQAMAYRLGIPAPQHPFLFPADRAVDAHHPQVMIDHNRCILCARCIRSSQELDGKHVFQFVNRGPQKRVQVNAEFNLAGTNLDVADKAVENCPVGAILVKERGYAVPVGERKYDTMPIGSEIESKRN